VEGILSPSAKLQWKHCKRARKDTDFIQRVWQIRISEHHPISFYDDERIVGWREK